MGSRLEISEVRFGRTMIPYRIERTGRRKTVAVSVAAGEGVLVKSPRAVPVGRLDRVVHEKARWILEKLREVGQVEARLPPREFVSGETFLYLGRQYRLKVEPRKEPGPVRLVGGWFRVEVPRDLKGIECAEAVRESLTSWYKGHAEGRIPERVDYWHRAVGVANPRVVIRDQEKRWGSCDARGVLRFNWRIIGAPMKLVDYVVVHELAHLKHQAHTKEYWALVGKVMADYEDRKEELRRLGPRLSW